MVGLRSRDSRGSARSSVSRRVVQAVSKAAFPAAYLPRCLECQLVALTDRQIAYPSKSKRSVEAHFTALGRPSTERFARQCPFIDQPSNGTGRLKGCLPGALPSAMSCASLQCQLVTDRQIGYEIEAKIIPRRNCQINQFSRGGSARPLSRRNVTVSKLAGRQIRPWDL